MNEEQKKIADLIMATGKTVLRKYVTPASIKLVDGKYEKFVEAEKDIINKAGEVTTVAGDVFHAGTFKFGSHWDFIDGHTVEEKVGVPVPTFGLLVYSLDKDSSNLDILLHGEDADFWQPILEAVFEHQGWITVGKKGVVPFRQRKNPSVVDEYKVLEFVAPKEKGDDDADADKTKRQALLRKNGISII